LVWGLLLFSFIALGCEKKVSEVPSNKPAPDKKESLREKVDQLQEKVDQLQGDLAWLNYRVRIMGGGSAEVSSEEKSYSIAQTNFGSFAILCKSVTPYLDGYKVQLGIGNLTSAQFNGAKISLRWGKLLNNSKDISVTNKFLPGRYTTIEVVMTPAKPEDIKMFSVTLNFNEIALF